MVYILTKGKKSINAEKNENVELPHTQVFCGGLCVARINVTKNKLIGATDTCLYKMQTADCRPDAKYRLQTIERVQNADWESEQFLRLV